MKPSPLYMRNICTSFLTSRRLLSSQNVKPFESVPGLKALPIIGVLHHFLPIVGTIGFQRNFFDMFGVFYEKYGNIAKMDGMFGRGTLVILFDPEDYDKVYRAEEIAGPLRPGFEALEHYREVLKKDRFDGVYGLTSAQGEKWRDFRTKVNPALLKPKLVKLYTPGLEDIAEELVARISAKKDDTEHSKDLELEIKKWALESIALVGLGTRLGCLRENLNEDHPARILMKCSTDITELSYKLEFSLNYKNRHKSSNFKKIIEVFDKQWEVSEKYINEAKRKILERDHAIPEEDQSIIEKLLLIDEKVAVMMVNEMLFAGIDTVTFTTITLLYYLANNQEAQKRLRQEIRNNTESRYFKACLKESQRLLPILPGNLRETAKGHVVCGYHIPKGVFAVSPNEFLSKLDKYYPKPMEFIPERWLVDKTHPLYYGNAHPMVTQPFGFGVRSCIGRRIAELEIQIFFKKFLNEMEVQWTGPPIKVVTKLFNTFKGPFYFKFRKA